MAGAKKRELESRDNTAYAEVRANFETRKKSLSESISTVEITFSEKISPRTGTTTTSPGGARATTMMAKQKPPIFDGKISKYANWKKRWEATLHAS